MKKNFLFIIDCPRIQLKLLRFFFFVLFFCQWKYSTKNEYCGDVWDLHKVSWILRCRLYWDTEKCPLYRGFCNSGSPNWEVVHSSYCKSNQHFCVTQIINQRNVLYVPSYTKIKSLDTRTCWHHHCTPFEMIAIAQISIQMEQLTMYIMYTVLINWKRKVIS